MFIVIKKAGDTIEEKECASHKSETGKTKT